MAIGGRGLLIEGAPGSGKSSLALALIDRGAILVGDDSLLLEKRGTRLFAQPHPETRGLVEVRNLGLIAMPVCEEAAVALVLRLDPAAPRFIEEAETAVLQSITLPMLRLCPEGPVQAFKAELALRQFGLAF